MQLCSVVPLFRNWHHNNTRDFQSPATVQIQKRKRTRLVGQPKSSTERLRRCPSATAIASVFSQISVGIQTEIVLRIPTRFPLTLIIQHRRLHCNPVRGCSNLEGQTQLWWLSSHWTSQQLTHLFRAEVGSSYSESVCRVSAGAGLFEFVVIFHNTASYAPISK